MSLKNIRVLVLGIIETALKIMKFFLTFFFELKTRIYILVKIWFCACTCEDNQSKEKIYLLEKNQCIIFFNNQILNKLI